MRKKLGEILVEGGLIDDFQLQAALGHQRQWGGRLGEILASKGFTAAEAVADALALQLSLARFEIGPDAVDLRATKLVAADLAERQGLVPFKVEGDRGEILWIAMQDPTDLATLDELQFQTGKRIKVAVASEAEIRSVMAFINDGTPLPDPRTAEPPVSVDDLSEADVLTEVEPLEEVDAAPVDAAVFVATPATGFAAPPVVATPSPGQGTPIRTPVPQPKATSDQPASLPAVPESDLDADLAALGLGDDALLPGDDVAGDTVAPQPFDPDSTAALISEALDRMAEGEALPQAAERYVNPTQMAAALTRLLIRKGIIDEIELIDELQKK